MKDVHNPPPHPKDPNRALHPGLEEDPDTFVELVDRTFYQLSRAGVMVAIIAYYPGLLPISQVSKAKVPTSKKVFPIYTSPTAHVLCLTGKAIRAPS